LPIIIYFDNCFGISGVSIVRFGAIDPWPPLQFRKANFGKSPLAIVCPDDVEWLYDRHGIFFAALKIEDLISPDVMFIDQFRPRELLDPF
jgi:hypothetical protein